MSQPLRQNDTEHEVHHRIGALYSTADELRPARHLPAAHTGLVTRTRWSIGRRLVSLGESVAGSHPTHA